MFLLMPGQLDYNHSSISNPYAACGLGHVSYFSEDLIMNSDRCFRLHAHRIHRNCLVAPGRLNVVPLISKDPPVSRTDIKRSVTDGGPGLQSNFGF